MTKEIKEIKQLIIKANQTTVITDLIDINMKISGYLVYLSEEEGALLKNKLVAYNERKITQAKLCLGYKDGVTKGERYAIVNTQDLMKEELDTEVEYQMARSFRVQVSEFCQALTQKIVALRRESEQTKYQQG